MTSHDGPRFVGVFRPPDHDHDGQHATIEVVARETRTSYLTAILPDPGVGRRQAESVLHAAGWRTNGAWRKQENGKHVIRVKKEES